MKNLILLAVQGAGKGSLAKRLVDKYGYIHISTGDLLRQRSQINDELGIKIKDMIDNGILVPDEILLEAIEDKITSNECQNGYILDGFPRNLKQATEYDKLLEKLNKNIGVVLNLTIPKDLLENRILGRRMCNDCGAIYNIYSDDDTIRPKIENICNKCGGSLYQRKDDNKDAMEKRVNTYYEQTAPLIDYYNKKNILYEIDSSDMSKCLKNVDDILNNLEV